ncbi:MAG: electron transport complex subunit RsxG [Pseudomonadota bacterium]
MNPTLKKMLLAAAILGLFSVFGTGVVSLTYRGTVRKIAEVEREALLENLHALVPKTLYDNDIAGDMINITEPSLDPTGPTTVYRARKKGQDVAAVAAVVAPDGYNGNIKILVAVLENGTLAGVRVVSHKETPGLGDEVEEKRSGWILGFAGTSLLDPVEDKWAVKRDGGAFDQFTGATITPRAVVNAVRRTLVYFRENKAKFFIAVNGEKKKEAAKQ